MNLTDNWQQILADIEHQMTVATYQATLAGSYPVALDGERLVIHVQSDQAQSWLANRPPRGLAAAAAAIFGQPLQLVFTANGAEPLPPVRPVELRPGDDPNDPLATYRHFDVSVGGYSQLLHYITTYWGAYLGAETKALFDYCRTFYKVPREIKGRPNPDWTPWTPAVRFRISDLTGAASCGKQLLLGRWLNCARFDEAYFEDGEVWETCQGCYPGGEIVQSQPIPNHPGGRPLCRRWRPGILERMVAEGVALWEREGDPLKPASVYHWLQIYQPLPLLTPAQVGGLSSGLQDRHAAFLLDHGLNVRQWQTQLAGVASLLPLTVDWSGATLRRGIETRTIKLASNDANLDGDKFFCPPAGRK